MLVLFSLFFKYYLTFPIKNGAITESKESLNGDKRCYGCNQLYNPGCCNEYMNGCYEQPSLNGIVQPEFNIPPIYCNNCNPNNLLYCPVMENQISTQTNFQPQLPQLPQFCSTCSNGNLCPLNNKNQITSTSQKYVLVPYEEYINNNGNYLKHEPCPRFKDCLRKTRKIIRKYYKPVSTGISCELTNEESDMLHKLKKILKKRI